MNEWLAGISALIANNHGWGYFFAFTFAFLEAMPVVGTIIPGLIVIPFIGLYIGNGVLPALTTYSCTFLGALIGDVASFWIGRIYASTIKNWKWFLTNHHHVVTAEHFIERYGSYCVVIGRFVGPMRSSVPFFTGILGLKPVPFSLAAIASAGLWSLAYLTPGVLAGALSMNIPAHVITHYIVVAIAVIMMYEVTRKRHLLISKLATYIGQNPNHLEHVVISCVTGVMLLIIMMTRQHVDDLNNIIGHLAVSFQTKGSIQAAVIISNIADRLTLCMSTIIVGSILIYQKQFRTAVHLGAKMLIIVIVILSLKQLIVSPRPDLTNPSLWLISHMDFDQHSFPSGHVGLISMFLFTLTSWQSQIKIWQNRLATCLILAVCLSRMLLSEHWFIDVLSSILIASCIHHIYELALSKPTSNQLTINFNSSMLILVSMSVMLLVIINPIKSIQSTIEQQNSYQELSTASEVFTTLAPIRTNRLGYQSDPLNVLLVGNITMVKEKLSADQWHVYDENPNILSRIFNLFNQIDLVSQPIFPALYEYNPPALIAHKEIPEGLLIIKLWNSYQSWQANTPDQKILIGNIHLKASPIIWYNLLQPLASNAYDQLMHIDNLFTTLAVDIPDKEYPLACWNGERWLLSI